MKAEAAAHSSESAEAGQEAERARGPRAELMRMEIGFFPFLKIQLQ